MSSNLILWLCVCWLPFLISYFLCNEASFKKNIVVGVTFPYEARDQKPLQDILRRFKKQEKIIAAVLTLLILPGILVRDFGLSLTLFLIWIDVTVIVPYIPYVRCNSRLKQYKKEMGWTKAKKLEASELSAAAQPIRYVHPAWFFLLALISLVPILIDREMLVGYLIDSLTIVLLWFCYRYLYRNKSEAVDANATRTEMLSRMRRYQWGRTFLWCAGILAAFNFILLLGKNHETAMLVLVILMTIGIVALMVSVETRTRKAQENLTKDSGQGYYIDDDEHWIGGVFYYNPNDSHFIINNRVGLNSSFNLARPAGRVILVVLAVLLLLMPLIGVDIMLDERSAIEITVQDSTLMVHHNHSTYTVDLNTVQSAEVLDSLPSLRRINGSAVGTLRKGRFSNAEYGSLTVCLKTDSGPWLLIVTSDRTYLFSSETSGEVQSVAALLTAKQISP
jgi:uncharacterized membrane protein